ncbi:hypothetical protein F5Y13DRAFT_149886 [Hypoxylon sp. FL1857]|nr:hypothetical protein F5Y13DRAFT_149886 [Hypoxylon sp. FL1857]
MVARRRRAMLSCSFLARPSSFVLSAWAFSSSRNRNTILSSSSFFSLITSWICCRMRLMVIEGWSFPRLLRSRRLSRLSR